ncbi:enoyl-ACP reductase FabI [Actinophytocola sediminis]
MLLQGKRILVTGVLTDASIAYSVATLAQRQGAEVVLTGHGRALSLTRLVAERLPTPCDVLEMDVTEPAQIDATAEELARRWGVVDGVVHAIGFAPRATMGGGFLTAPWEDVSTALRISTYSFAALGRAFGPLLGKAERGSLVGLDFDARQAWPGYDWMGVAKAGLESCCRYLASALGPQGTRVNLVAAGPIRTMAMNSIPGADRLAAHWEQHAPLGWDATDPSPVGQVVCALLSDWLPSITGEVLHADGGVHAVAIAPEPAR